MMDHIDKLALQQQHDDHIEAANLTKKLIQVMEFLNNKDIAVNLPENLRIKHDGVQQVEGNVKAIVANAISVENLDELAKHLELIATEIQKSNELAGETNKRIADGLVVPPAMVMLYDQFLEAIAILRELGKKDFGVAKASNTVVVFPKTAKEAIPVRLVMSKEDRFYDAIFNSSFSAPDTVRINNDSGNPVPVEIVGGASSAPVGINDASDNRINPATKEDIDAIASALADLATEQTADDQVDILNEIQIAVEAIAYARGVSADLRVTIIGGSVGIATNQTLATLTNLAQMGAQPLQPYIPAQLNLTAIQSNINNVIVS